jgi:hypothetical protein
MKRVVLCWEMSRQQSKRYDGAQENIHTWPDLEISSYFEYQGHLSLPSSMAAD